MDILIKPKKNHYIIYAIIIAIFSTVGMNISLMNTNADKLLKKFEYSSTWNNFMAVFRTSISREERCKTVLSVSSCRDYPDVSCYIFLSFLCSGNSKFRRCFYYIWILYVVWHSIF